MTKVAEHYLPAETQALLDCFSDPAILCTQDYQILAANRAYRHLHELEHVEPTSSPRTCYAASHHYDRPCDQAGETCPLKASQETGEPQRVLHVHHTPRGQEHVEVTLYPIRDASGKIAYFLEVMHHAQLASVVPDSKGLVGRSESFQHMLSLVQRVAPTETTVLLLGESGTGKELVAKAVHAASQRANGPLVPVECSGLTESLFESELFGHEKGSFTGAVSRKRGLVEAAAGGTLFLDEVGDIPLSLQVKLLRLLETGTYRRVGEVEVHQANFRLVCATHRGLKSMVEQGSFRQDLYYRISAFPIVMPPLRERTEDISLLAETLLQRIQPKRKLRISREALNCLQHYEFPGNVRELRNLLERACLLCDGDVLTPAHFAESCQLQTSHIDTASLPSTELQPLAEVEADYLRWALSQHQGDRHSLAERLGISERTLYRKIQSLNGAQGN